MTPRAPHSVQLRRSTLTRRAGVAESSESPLARQLAARAVTVLRGGKFCSLSRCLPPPRPRLRGGHRDGSARLPRRQASRPALAELAAISSLRQSLAESREDAVVWRDGLSQSAGHFKVFSRNDSASTGTSWTVFDDERVSRISSRSMHQQFGPCRALARSCYVISVNEWRLSCARSFGARVESPQRPLSVSFTSQDGQKSLKILHQGDK